MATENNPDLQTVAFRNMVTQNGTPVHQTVALRDTEAGQSETSRVAGRTSGSIIPSLRFFQKVGLIPFHYFFLVFLSIFKHL